jgi:glycosyltransferase involved in cell wall biosynthesis
MTDHVLLPGKINRTALPDIYRAGDLYALPSHVEPYGLVLMEALACGTPAVAGHVGGPPSYVPRTLRDEGHAILVDPIKLTSDGEALPDERAAYALSLADGMQRILNMNIGSAERTRIAHAMKPLSWSRLVESLAQIYDRLLADRLSKLDLRTVVSGKRS